MFEGEAAFMGSWRFNQGPGGSLNAVALARWLSEQKGEPVRFERVESGDERILEPRSQHELDALPSALDREED